MLCDNKVELEVVVKCMNIYILNRSDRGGEIVVSGKAAGSPRDQIKGKQVNLK